MAAKIVSMKRTKEDKRADAGSTAPIEALAPDYPYGLVLNLDKDELDKLGIKKLPKAGSEFLLTAKAKVTRVNQSAVEGEDDQNNVALQITDMGIE